MEWINGAIAAKVVGPRPQLVTELKMVGYWRNTGNWGDFCNPIGVDDFECH